MLESCPFCHFPNVRGVLLRKTRKAGGYIYLKEQIEKLSRGGRKKIFWFVKIYRRVECGLKSFFQTHEQSFQTVFSKHQIHQTLPILRPLQRNTSRSKIAAKLWKVEGKLGSIKDGKENQEKGKSLLHECKGE